MDSVHFLLRDPQYLPLLWKSLVVARMECVCLLWCPYKDIKVLKHGVRQKDRQ